MAINRNDRLAPPLMYAFRAAHDKRDANVREEELKIRFLVKADLRARPANVPVEFIAEVELDSGKIKIDRL